MTIPIWLWALVSCTSTIGIALILFVLICWWKGKQ